MRFIFTLLASLLALPMGVVLLVVDGNFVERFIEGGVVMLVLVPVAIIMVMAIVGAAALELKKPGPIVLYFLGPMAVLLVGAVGAFSGHQKVFSAMAAVDPDNLPSLFAAGSAEASQPLVWGLSLVGSGLFAVFVSGVIGAVFERDGRAWNGAWLALIGGTFGIWAYGRAAIESAQAMVYSGVARVALSEQARFLAEGVSSLEFRRLVTHVLVGVVFLIGVALVVARRKYASDGAKLGIVLSVVAALLGTAMAWAVISTEARQVMRAEEVMANSSNPKIELPVVADTVTLVSLRRTYKLSDRAYGKEAFLTVAGDVSFGEVEAWTKDQHDVVQLGFAVAQERSRADAERLRTMLSDAGVPTLPLPVSDGLLFRRPPGHGREAPQHVLRTDEGYISNGELVVDPEQIKSIGLNLVLHLPSSLPVSDVVKELIRFENPMITSAPLKPKKRPVIDNGELSSGSPRIVGSLPKEVIRRVVRRNLSQVRYCYERELMKNPRLVGKLTIKWVVAADGTVARASVMDSQLNNPAVERCMTQKIKRWRFPKPKGGGIVVVKYPFIFNPQ